jgi:putative ABC transport system substrate-binding protein
MSICIRRREFITLVGGAVAWPLAARAQQGDRVRRIGVLLGRDDNDRVAMTHVSAFTQKLRAAGVLRGEKAAELPRSDCRQNFRWP